jgi:glyoxylase-like metal-dependent hydrolase (beta-lactamase superfamily II)
LDCARTVLGKGRYWTTAYYLDGLLIDSGCAHTAKEFMAALSGMPVHTLVNTHSHEDHIGANHVLQERRAGLEILAHPLAIPILAAPAERQPLQLYRRHVWGMPGPSHASALHEGMILRSVRFEFQVIFTPGHSRDHVCLYAPEQGWLFSGDLFVGGRDRALGASFDIWGILHSLRKVAALEVGVLYPGCARVRHAPQVELQEKIAYLEQMGARVQRLHQAGQSVAAISRQVCGGPMLIEAFTGGRFSRRNLVRSFLRRESRD